MKRLYILLILAFSAAAHSQNPCGIVITGTFESECNYDFKGAYANEYPDELIACQHSQVTYTAHIAPALNVAAYSWEVVGAVAHSATGNQLTVDWGDDEWGLLTVETTLADGTTCGVSKNVRLIAPPVAASSTVPAYTIDASGNRVIYICDGGRVEFLDQSDAVGSDLAGHLWTSLQAPPSTTPNYVVAPVSANDHILHRVYNNCGCYDEEEYYIKVLEGENLSLECYGTVCEGSVVTYTAVSPACDEYMWHVEGGTLLGGQGSPTPTVQWGRPTDGYGVLSLDGVHCGDMVCPGMLGVKIPVIHGDIAIEGPEQVCVGESAIYSLPLFGSTRYQWNISPTVVTESDIENSNTIRVRFPAAGTYHIRVSYRCDFLGCGPFDSKEFTVTVSPSLSIIGPEQICTSNSCNLHTEPATTATWQAYDLGNGNQPEGAAVTGNTFSRTFPAGHYLVTAEHPDYCGPATFVLHVKAPPLPPDEHNLSDMNLHHACPDGGVSLTGTPAEPHYSLVWTPACSTATPQLYAGDSVSISYGDDVCDVWVYHYDRVLQCQSTTPYVHAVSALVPKPTTLPSAITVCPNTEVSFYNEVPDQRIDGMLYEWKLDPLNQRCASVRGSHQQPAVTLLINDLHATAPYTFYVELTRSYCNNQSVTDRVYITVRDDLMPNIAVSGPSEVCAHSTASYSCSGCPTGCQDVSYTFGEPGDTYITLRCNPYDVCSNSSMYASAGMTVHVIPLPEAQLNYNSNTNKITVSVTPSSGSYSYDWYYRDDYGVLNPTSLGTSTYVNPISRGYYECTVTDLISQCCTTVTYHYPPATPCEPFTLNHGSFNYCSHTMRFISPLNDHWVFWHVIGGDHSIVSSGTNNCIADVTFEEVGTYTVSANLDAYSQCYRGHYTFDVGFIKKFSFSSHCNEIIIFNGSKYLNGSNYVYMTVTNDCNDNVDYISFPVSQSTYTYTPMLPSFSVCTYTFTLTGFGTNDNINNCPLGSATIGSPMIPVNPVTITTSNTFDTPPEHNTCDNTPILLTASLSYSGATVVNSTWNFGDGSTYHLEGNSVYHTFKKRNSEYLVNVSVTDSRGCVRSTTSPLQITANQDNLISGKLDATPPLICPHIIPPIQEIHFTSQGNHYTWGTPLSGTSYQNYVSKPDIYRVSVVDNHFCQKEGATYVPFLPCPTARIYADNFSCCEGEPLTLYGSLAPASGISYLWTIVKTGGGYSQTFTTDNISFIPPAAGSYDVSLTVTDLNNGCSSTSHATVTAIAPPPAPTLSFAGDSCISNAPVTLAASGYSGTLLWSNGATGATAQYYTPGIASAYYYDPALGCPSRNGTLRIHHQPDFDAMLTGCYEKCIDKGHLQRLPVYSLTPDFIDWQWYRNGIIAGSQNHVVTPLELLLTNYGSYTLEVDYQNGGCHATSPSLSVSSKKNCDCDSVSVAVDSVEYKVDKCELQYTVKLTVCNESRNEVLCIDDIEVLPDANNVQVTNVIYTSTTINPNHCETIELSLNTNGLIPPNVLLQLDDASCRECIREFVVDLMPDVDCQKEPLESSMELDLEISNEAAAYCLFSAKYPASCQLLALWTSPAMVVDYTYSPATGFLEGICFFDRAVLQQMASADEEVCLRALLCCNDSLCIYTQCILAADLLNMLRTEYNNGEDTTSDAFYSSNSAPTLAGNPATGKVMVVGTRDDIVEVMVMDMHGRQLARHLNVSHFDVTGLPSGSYIVRITTQSPHAPVKHHYRKLIKK